MLDAPTAPLSKRVVVQVPSMRFKNVDEVAQIPAGAVIGCPANGVEFPDVNVNTIAVLKSDHRLERLFELGFVPLLAFDQAGIAISWSWLMHTLVGECVRQLQVNAIDHVRDPDRDQLVQTLWSAPL